MRKEFKNAKAKHGLNSKKWERRQIGIRPSMALLLRPKYLLVYKNKKGRAQTDRRRGEEKETKKKKKRREERRRKWRSRKIQRYGI